MVNVDELRQLLECIPQDTVGYAFAYGSGAVSQLGEKSDVKMVDFIIVSNNSLKFHEENLQRNPCHYSALRYFGANTLTKLQRNFAARVFYNTHISYKGRLLKYGVVEYEDLERDLLDWRWLYLAGRLHKVVVDIVPPPKTLAAAIHENRISAIALLLLPGTFTLEQFLTMVVSLSYNGDFRMLFGEDKNKIKKIVDGSSQKLAEIFMPILENDTRLTITRTSLFELIKDTNMAAVYHRIQLLPCAILERLQKVWNQRDSKQRDIEEVTFSLARRLDVAHHIDDAISSIVAPSAIRQTVKNFLTAGITRSSLYALSKMLKMFKSLA
ncbi:unnamed protein product [Dracunculus medinensis]|uniref:Phosphatidate cytidylyltransferase, mitochondrial n=1 Tax=Dracunculus medinensis TaxID=318479 RepID=A0A0N4U949_DRAME|nr:unnamed protein product [Dracunculus medinensis]